MTILKRYGKEEVIAFAEIDTYYFTICKAYIFYTGIVYCGQRKITSFKLTIHKACIAKVAFSEIAINEFAVAEFIIQ